LTILFVANRFPYPPFRGDKLKIYNLAKRLAKKHKLILVTFTQDENDIANIPQLKSIFSKIVTVHLPFHKSVINCLRILIGDKKPLQVLYFYSKEFKKKLSDTINIENPDVIHVQHLRMSQYLPQLNNKPAILDLPDAFSLYWDRRVKSAKNFLTRWFNNFEFKRVLRYEKIMSKFQLNLACSQEDIHYLKEQHGFEHIKLLPNGVDLETFSADNHDYSHNQTLLFTGNMNYAPNVDAVIYFTKEVLPIIKNKFPDVRFVIAGQKPVSSVQELASESIEVTGFVQEISFYYQNASLVVAPLRFGAGTQNKVLEALAMGVPVVCSNIGFSGLNIQSGEGAFCETNAIDFAQRVISLLEDANLRKTTGERGKEIIRNKFDWNVLSDKLEHYFEEVQHG
jgi:sugar transferase (PEP-CTERM/EpsH1 system associated)